MTVRGSQRAVARTSLGLLAALVLSCATSGIDRALALPQPQPEPEPVPPGLFYGDPVEEAENIVSTARSAHNLSSPTIGIPPKENFLRF